MYIEYMNDKHDLVVDMSEDIEQNTHDLILKVMYCITLLVIFYIACDCIKNK